MGFRSAALGPSLVVLLAGLAPGCEESDAQAATPEDEDVEMSLVLRSGAFADGEAIPREHTCDGEDRSPPLTFSGVPDRAASLALIVDDPDAPRGTWLHWLVWNLPAPTDGLEAGVPAAPTLPDGARQGRNDFGRPGWGGPCPPPGDEAHHYHFRLFALDQALDVGAGAGRAQVEQAMQGHVVAQAQLVGTYERAPE